MKKKPPLESSQTNRLLKHCLRRACNTAEWPLAQLHDSSPAFLMWYQRSPYRKNMHVYSLPSTLDNTCLQHSFSFDMNRFLP